MRVRHIDLPDAGTIAHAIIDHLLPVRKEKDILRTLGEQAPQTVSGARDEPEGALKDLLRELEDLGLITDNTSAS